MSKEKRLDEILGRLDCSETPMDDLAVEAKDAARIIVSMQKTLTATKAGLRVWLRSLPVPYLAQRLG